MLFISEILFTAAINIWCIVRVKKFHEGMLRWVMLLMLFVCLIKYPVQLLFEVSSLPIGLYRLRFFYMISIPMIFPLSYLQIRLLKNPALKGLDMLYFTMLLLIPLFIALKTVVGIEMRSYGYGIFFAKGWQMIYAVASVFFCIMLLYVAMVYFIHEKRPAVKLVYILFVFGNLTLAFKACTFLTGFSSNTDYLTAEGILLTALTVSLGRMARG